ncbi:MAG: hypothetical protein AB1Z98_23790 [Nannocystaceae bacterium]
MWSLAGEGLYAAGTFGALVLLARLGSVEALGQFTLGMAIATPAILLTNLHLRPAYVIDEGGWRYPEYLSLRLLTIPLALVITAVAAWLGGLDGRTAAVVLAVGGLRAWEALSDILLAPAQKAERMAAIGRSRALRGLLTAGGLGVGLALTGDLLVGLGLSLALLGGLSLLHDARVARRFASARARPPSRRLLRLARHTLPIGLAAALLAASVNLPAYVLERSFELTTLGYFGAVMSVVYVAGVLNVSLGNAAIPRLARRAGSGQLRSLLLRLLLVVTALNGALVLGTVLLGPTYLRLAYGEAYAAYAPELTLAAVAAAVAGVANMLSQTVTALGRFGQQLRINLIGVVGSAVAALWLVPSGGLRGAVWAVLALASLRLCIYVAVLRGRARDPAAAPTPARRSVTPPERVGRPATSA